MLLTALVYAFILAALAIAAKLAWLNNKPPAVPVLDVSLLAVLSFVVPYLLPYAGQIAVMLIVALFGLIAKLLLKLKDGKVKHASMAVTDAVKEGFIFVEQQVAPTLRGPDGKLSPEAGQMAKAAAVSAAIEYLTKHGIDNVKAALKKSDAELEADLGVALDKLAEAKPSNESAVVRTSEKIIVTLPSGTRVVKPVASAQLPLGV
jgi:hypothetical protein